MVTPSNISRPRLWPASGHSVSIIGSSVGTVRQERGKRRVTPTPIQFSWAQYFRILQYYNSTCPSAKCCSSFRPKVLITAPPRNTRSPAWSWWRWSSHSCSSLSWPSSSWSSYLGTATIRVTKCRSLGVICHHHHPVILWRDTRNGADLHRLNQCLLNE